MVKFKNITPIVIGRALAVYSLLSVFILLSPPSHALGRLFFTPEQRQNLDQNRQQPRAQKVSPIISPVESFSVTGMVKRDDGSTTLWVSKVPDDAAEFNSPLKSGDDEKVMTPGLRRKLPNRPEDNSDEKISRIVKPPSSDGGLR